LSRTTSKFSSNSSALPLVIVNPRSAGGATERKWAATASDLRTHFGPFSVAFTREAGDGIRLARHGVESGRKLIIACGGDGTINEVANGILQMKSDVEMAILPSGTGGDLRRSIKMPQNPREAARALLTGSTIRIDVGRVTFQDFDDRAISRYFLNVSSFGLSASIIERVKTGSSLSWLPLDVVRGKASFAISTLQEIVGLDYSIVKVKIDDGEERTLNTINFCVANASYFGGGMKIAPDAKLADGLFDVVNIGDLGTAKMILNSYTLYRGTHVELPEVKCKRARKIEAHPALPETIMRLEVDGELPGKLPAVFEIVPSALKFRIPQLG
jgi:diacylglycerol kinase (ATP)